MKECQAPKEKNSLPTIDSQACDVSFKESTTSSNLYNVPALESLLQQCKLQEIGNHLLLPCFFQVRLKHAVQTCSVGWTKKAIADEEKGEGTWANFSKAASRLGKSVRSPQRIRGGGGGICTYSSLGIMVGLVSVVSRTCFF